jgi:putative ABC transport system substrate-binding protein
VLAGARLGCARRGLFAYAPDNQEVYDIVAGYVHRILDGKLPAEMPVQQATRFGLHLNAVAAHSLGLTIPTGIRLRATEVIERYKRRRADEVIE